MDKIKNIIQKVKGGWEKIDKKRRKALVFVVVALALIAGAYGFYTNQVTYAPLFTNLDLQDAANITADLDTRADIKYKLENGGKDIYIDQKYVDKYRLELATKGLMPQSTTGFELFDNASLMTTDQDRAIMYQRATQGELERSIASLSEIKSARVHLVMSNDSVFNSEKTQASASVLVEVKPGYKLSKDQVNGIVALVSGAVENLPEANVKVIDSLGNILNLGSASGNDTSGVASYDNQSQIKSNFESELQSNIMSLLGPAFGTDKIKVAVYSDLDFNATEQTVISYKDPVIVSEQKSATGAGVNSSTVSSNSNDTNTQNVLNSSGSNSLATYNGTANYDVTQSTTKTVTAPGQVKKITTSIVFDGNLTDAQKLSIKNIVATATGYDASRGDMINIEGVVFDSSYKSDLNQTQTNAASTFFNKYKIFIFAGAGLLVLIILTAVLMTLSGKKKRAEEMQLTSGVPVTVGENVDILDEIYRKKIKAKENIKEKQVKEYVQEHPDVAADLIKAWLKD